MVPILNYCTKKRRKEVKIDFPNTVVKGKKVVVVAGYNER